MVSQLRMRRKHHLSRKRFLRGLGAKGGTRRDMPATEALHEGGEQDPGRVSRLFRLDHAPVVPTAYGEADREVSMQGGNRSRDFFRCAART